MLGPTGGILTETILVVLAENLSKRIFSLASSINCRSLTGSCYPEPSELGPGTLKVIEGAPYHEMYSLKLEPAVLFLRGLDSAKAPIPQYAKQIKTSPIGASPEIRNPEPQQEIVRVLWRFFKKRLTRSVAKLGSTCRRHWTAPGHAKLSQSEMQSELARACQDAPF